MGLLINQGKQDVSGDVFAPIVEKDAQLVVHSLGLVKGKAGVLEICLRVLTGPNKNRMVFDRVSYDAKDKMSWKYRQLRAAAGVPYTTDEPAEIDIEALLLNRPLIADLSVREYEKDGQTRKAQDVKYHRAEVDVQAIAQPSAEEVLRELGEEATEQEPEKKKPAKLNAKQETPQKPSEPVDSAVAEAIEEIADEWE